MVTTHLQAMLVLVVNSMCILINIYIEKNRSNRPPPQNDHSPVLITIFESETIAHSTGLDKSTLIHRWCYDASRALKVAHQCCLQCHARLEVIIIDLLNE